MADSTSDISKMKVVELKKELKTRGLAATGDKSELVSRLQAALAKDAHTENTLDSDELDSDDVLDDDDDKNDTDLINEDLINDVPLSTTVTSKPQETDVKKNSTPTTRVLKRKPPPIITSTESVNEDKLLSPDEPSPPKIRVTPPSDNSIPTKQVTPAKVPISAPAKSEAESESTNPTQAKVIKLTMDTKERLEMRAKRFGTPLIGDAAKEARKARFGLMTSSPSSNIQKEKSASLDVLKKRAERFGTSVSKTVQDEEYKEKLEKRKARFGLINA